MNVLSKSFFSQFTPFLEHSTFPLHTSAFAHLGASHLHLRPCAFAISWACMANVERVVRVRGLQAPYSKESLVAWIAIACSMALGLAALAVCARTEDVSGPIAGLAAADAVVIAAWLYCVGVDPAGPGGVACAPMAATQTRERYCRLCAKSVPGLDHHCAWLNTCVGRRTYAAFFALVVAATLQHALQIGLVLASVTAWARDSLSPGTYVLAALACASGLGGVLGAGSVAAFHVFLLTVGLGTYDWLLQRHQPRGQRRAGAGAGRSSGPSVGVGVAAGSGGAGESRAAQNGGGMPGSGVTSVGIKSVDVASPSAAIRISPGNALNAPAGLPATKEPPPPHVVIVTDSSSLEGAAAHASARGSLLSNYTHIHAQAHMYAHDSPGRTRAVQGTGHELSRSPGAQSRAGGLVSRASSVASHIPLGANAWGGAEAAGGGGGSGGASVRDADTGTSPGSPHPGLLPLPASALRGVSAASVTSADKGSVGGEGGAVGGGRGSNVGGVSGEAAVAALTAAALARRRGVQREVRGDEGARRHTARDGGGGGGGDYDSGGEWSGSDSGGSNGSDGGVDEGTRSGRRRHTGRQIGHGGLHAGSGDGSATPKPSSMARRPTAGGVGVVAAAAGGRSRGRSRSRSGSGMGYAVGELASGPAARPQPGDSTMTTAASKGEERRHADFPPLASSLPSSARQLSEASVVAGATVLPPPVAADKAVGGHHGYTRSYFEEKGRDTG